jgi:hypothetical protein
MKRPPGLKPGIDVRDGAALVLEGLQVADAVVRQRDERAGDESSKLRKSARIR